MSWAAENYAERLLVAKLEIDGNPLTRDAFQVKGIPTIILFREGIELVRHEGVIAKPNLKELIDAHF